MDFHIEMVNLKKELLKKIIDLDTKFSDLFSKKKEDIPEEVLSPLSKINLMLNKTEQMFNSINEQQIKLDKIHFAFDRWEDKDIVEPRLRKFVAETGYNRGKGHVMCYILVNFNTTLEQDIYRIQLCRELNISPYPMIYDKEHCDPVYRKLQRWCNNFIFWSVPTFEQYMG